MLDTTGRLEDVRFVGGELRPFPDGATMLVTPAGRLYRIEAAPDTVWSFLTERPDGPTARTETCARSWPR